MTQKNFHQFFTLYFIIFGIIISLFGAAISYSLQINDIQKDLDKKAKEIFEIKNNIILKSSITNIDNTLKSLAHNQIIQNFIANKELHNEEDFRFLFLGIVNSNNTIMQARLLDKNGQEIIRIDRNNKNEDAFIIDNNKLQNKANRDYFKKLSSIDKDFVWHSKLDLNMENDKIEIPYKPTLRAGMSLYKNNKFVGIVIINILIQDLFDSIRTSSTFEHYIIDDKQNYILHPNTEFSFNKYKNIKRDIKEDFPNGLKEKDIYTYSLKDILNNEDNAVMILKIKNDYHKMILTEKLNTAIIVFLLTVILSLIMAFLVSKTPTKLQAKLLKAYEKLNEFRIIIDKYVITATAKPDNTIVEVSTAFEKSSGYSKQELIGKSMSMIGHPDREKLIIKELWNTILNNKTWEGEIKNRNKNGEEYWLKQHIIPKMNDENTAIENFVSVGIDITDKKKLEELASIDKLTGIYNRRMLDEFLQIKIEEAKRYKEELSLIIIDIDHFKDVNDTYGHLVGDDTLAQTSAIISTHLRTSDIFGRYGGEEFLIICSKTSKENAFILAEKLRIEIKEFEFEKVGHKTISLGISNFEEKDTVQSLFEKADDALYEAKNTGRDKSIMA